MVGIELDLADVIGKKIDLVTEGSLNPYIKDRVMKDLVVIYDKKIIVHKQKEYILTCQIDGYV